jgi:hypothetical protein
MAAISLMRKGLTPTALRGVFVVAHGLQAAPRSASFCSHTVVMHSASDHHAADHEPHEAANREPNCRLAADSLRGSIRPTPAAREAHRHRGDAKDLGEGERDEREVSCP